MFLLTEIAVQVIGPGGTGPASLVASSTRLIAMLAVLAGLPGLHLAAGRRTRWGAAAAVTAFTGTVLLLGDLWFEAFVYPFVAEAAPELIEAPPSGTFIAGALVTFAVFLLGWAAMAVSLYHARVVSRLPAALLLVGITVAFPAPLYSPRLAVWCAALAWLAGGLTRRERGDESRRS